MENRDLHAGGALSGMAISACPPDLSRLRAIFEAINWRLHEARSCREASSVLCSYRMPVIVCDRLLPDGQWKDILSIVAPIQEPPRVIVMAASPDDPWTSEALQLGAYSILRKPLDEIEARQLLLNACRTWQKLHARPPLRVSAA